MSFASEVKQVTSKTAAPIPTLPTQAPAPSAPAEPKSSDAVLNEGMPPLPEHGSVHPEQAAKQGLAPSEINGSEVTPPLKAEGAKIRIGSELFDSAEDAIAYATELQLTLAQKDAVEQYKTSTQPKPASEPEHDIYADLESKLFEDPKGTLKTVIEMATKEAEAKAEARLKAQQEADQRRQVEEQSWQSFFSENADLSHSKDLVEYVMTKHWDELSKLSPQKAPAALAAKTRALLGSRREEALPTKELQNRSVNMPGSSSVANQPAPIKKEAPVDFISQVKKHGKRT